VTAVKLFLAQIQGANGCKAYALGRRQDGEAVEVFAQTHDSTDWRTLLVGSDYDESGWDETVHPPAIFSSREAAREAALAARWNNQSFRVIPARGAARERGVLVEIAGEWASCQEGTRS